jgi:hypothetical protein
MIAPSEGEYRGTRGRRLRVSSRTTARTCSKVAALRSSLRQMKHSSLRFHACLTVVAALVSGGVACKADGTRVEFFEIDGSALSRQEQRIVDSIARLTVREVRMLLPLPEQIVVRVQPGRDVMRETGENGTAVHPNTVVWTVDPSHRGGVREVAHTWLRACLFHELHHLVRDAAIRREAMLDVAVTEGMATAFERDFAGVAVPWGEYPPTADAWVQELLALPDSAKRGPWLGRHPDGRRWVALRAGTYLVDRASHASHKTSADLVLASTAKVVQLARAP